MSFIEAVANVLVGILVALAIQIAAFPLLGLKVSFRRNLLLGALFTIISMIRSFTLPSSSVSRPAPCGRTGIVDNLIEQELRQLEKRSGSMRREPTVHPEVPYEPVSQAQ